MTHFLTVPINQDGIIVDPNIDNVPNGYRPQNVVSRSAEIGTFVSWFCSGAGSYRTRW